MKINPFIIIVDIEGDAVDVVSGNYNLDNIQSLLDYYNENESYPPYFAYLFEDNNTSKYRQITDIHPTALSSKLSNQTSINKSKLHPLMSRVLRENNLKKLGFEEPTEEQKAKGKYGA
jgi:hypothetical protein